MEKKLLIAVDPSIHSLHALEYAHSLEPEGKNLKCTLFNIQPSISSFLLEEAKTGGKANAELKKVIQHNATVANRFLAEYKDKLIRKGWKADQIDLISHPKIQGTAKDILDYAQVGLFDAVIAGRRGVTAAQEVFTGSVTTNLLEHSRLIPIWVVDKSISIRRVLAAVDGSKSAQRIVEHLSYVLTGIPHVHVTLFHVSSRAKADPEVSPEDAAAFKKIMTTSGRHHIEAFFENAWERFSATGFPLSRLGTKTAPSALNVGKAIVNEANKGGYDTVVVGRSGEERAFFMGSVSRYVLRKLSGAALWLVP